MVFSSASVCVFVWRFGTLGTQVHGLVMARRSLFCLLIMYSIKENLNCSLCSLMAPWTVCCIISTFMTHCLMTRVIFKLWVSVTSHFFENNQRSGINEWISLKITLTSVIISVSIHTFFTLLFTLFHPSYHTFEKCDLKCDKVWFEVW